MNLFKRIFASLLIVTGVLSLVPPAQAQFAENELEMHLEAAGTRGAGLTATSPFWIIANIVTILLLLIGTIIFCFFFYAGFIWLTAAGDDEKVLRAKSIIKTTVIGLLIVLVSLSLTRFVMYYARQATGNAPPGIMGPGSYGPPPMYY